MSTTLPVGSYLIVNLVRVAHGELAQPFVVFPASPVKIEEMAFEAGQRAAALIDRGAVPGDSLVITLNLLRDQDRQGGCSWQGLTFSRPVDRDLLAANVDAVVSMMVADAAVPFLAALEAPLPGTPLWPTRPAPTGGSEP